jgi:hypothetical protein
VEAACELSELLERAGELLAGAHEDPRGFRDVGLDPRLGEAKREGQCGEALLCAVVEVPLQAAPRSIRRVDDPRARGP